MKFPLLSRFVQSRRSLKLFARLVAAEEQSAAALTRLADQFAPVQKDTPPAELQQTGALYRNVAELVRIEEYVERCMQDTGRAPTEEEIVRHLDGEEVRL